MSTMIGMLCRLRARGPLRFVCTTRMYARTTQFELNAGRLNDVGDNTRDDIYRSGQVQVIESLINDLMSYVLIRVLN